MKLDGKQLKASSPTSDLGAVRRLSAQLKTGRVAEVPRKVIAGLSWIEKAVAVLAVVREFAERIDAVLNPPDVQPEGAEA